MDNFYHFDLNFTYSFFCFAQSAGKSFYFDLLFQLFLLFFTIIIVSISLVKFSMYLFTLGIFATVSLCIVTFESLSDNIIILVISASVCIAYFFY